jgi:holliday junction DNA helicase RuvB
MPQTLTRRTSLAILELNESATPEEIRSAYRDLVRVWHPDRFGSDSTLRQKAEHKLQRINAAFEFLRSGREPEPEVQARPPGQQQPSRSPRPKAWSDLIGQQTAARALATATAAALERHEPCPHVLLVGPPGTGKTTLAHLVAHSQGGQLTVTTGNVLRNAPDVAGLILRSSLSPMTVLFIDEIHRMAPAAEETLYAPLEDGVIDVILGQGATARTLRHKLNPFTLVAATTRADLITAPLRSRFPLNLSTTYYSVPELAQIATRAAARQWSLTISPQAADELARRAQGIPRRVLSLLRVARDHAQNNLLGAGTAVVACESIGVDSKGLDGEQRAYLAALHRANGTPLSIDSIAATLGHHPKHVEAHIEPYLLRAGFVLRTPRGRLPGPAKP